MQPKTAQLWKVQDRHEGDRQRLFAAVSGAVAGSRVLYPGSFVDIAPSFLYPSVTYVDSDDRAFRFFDDRPGVRELIVAAGGRQTSEFRFVHGDYRHDLGEEADSYDLLVSLYAGFVSEFCTLYLRIGGTLLVAPSHGDVAMASIDERYDLSGIVTSRSGDYRVGTGALDTYLVPKRPVAIDREMLHERGKGIAYTKSPFAYLFTRVR